MNKKNPASSPASRLGEERPGQQLYKGKRKKMNRTQLEHYFSAERVKKYFNEYPGNDPKAIYLYQANILLSEALYTPLSILEVALRNNIDRELTRKYGRHDWYAEWYKDKVMHQAWKDVNQAINQLHRDGKPIDPDRVIAALMFGFWTSLFNDQYDRELWRNLRFIFANMPQNIRQRRNVSKPLNEIRRYLRNRIYHNEPVIFKIAHLQNHYNSILQVMDWIGADLKIYNDAFDKFPATLHEIKTKLSTL